MKKTCYLLLALASLVACSKANNAIAPKTASKIAVDPIITKANETNFDSGDKIGVTITRGTETYASNAQMTFNGELFQSDIFWYTEGEQTSKFVAYYPYAATIPTTFTVAADQSTVAGYGNSDLMIAVKDQVEPQGSVTMVFKHMLTRIVVNIDNQLGAKVNSVVLKNSLTKADIDYTVPAATLATDAVVEDITCATVTPNQRYAAIVVPQTVEFTAVVNLDGKSISKKLNSTTLKAGGQYTISISILPGDVKIALAGEIENWSDEGVITDKVVTFNEYLDAAEPYFEYDGLNYKVVKLADNNWWMAEPMAFLPDGVIASDSPSATATDIVYYPYSSDATNCTPLKDAASIKAKGYLYRAAAVFGTELTADNYDKFEGKQGAICPNGWHVPTRAEYFALVGTSNKSDYLGETSAPTNEQAFYYVASHKGSTVGKLNEAGFNFVLSGCVANNAYSKLLVSGSNCSVEAYYGNPSMTYLWTSSPNKFQGTTQNLFALMTTFSTGLYPEGRLSLATAAIDKVAAPLRCVRDAQ